MEDTNWTCRECETENRPSQDARDAVSCRSCGCARTEAQHWADDARRSAAAPPPADDRAVPVVVVTRHKARRVIGVLPLHLAAVATSVTEVPLDIPAAMRGKELTLAQVRAFARPPVTYTVRVTA